MKLRYLALAGAAGLLTTFTVSIAQDRNGEGSSSRHRPDPSQIVERADADGDGRVSYDEATAALPGMTEERFERMDRNGDGFLEGNELQRHRREGGRHPGGKRGRSPEAMKKFFDEQDANNDGVLSLDEMTNAFRHRMEERFEKLDSDGDGGLSPEELRAGGSPRWGGKGRQGGDRRGAWLDEADTDGSGELSLEEIQAVRPVMTGDRFARLDADNSGGLSREELLSGRGSGKERSVRVFDRLDTDGNGALSREEAEAARFGPMAERFDEIDADSDGSITPEELRSAMMQRRGGGRQGHGGPSQ